MSFSVSTPLTKHVICLFASSLLALASGACRSNESASDHVSAVMLKDSLGATSGGREVMTEEGGISGGGLPQGCFTNIGETLAGRTYSDSSTSISFLDESKASLTQTGAEAITYTVDYDFDSSCFVRLGSTNNDLTRTFLVSFDLKTLSDWNNKETVLVQEELSAIALSGLTFSRTIMGTGYFGSPAGPFEHSLVFIDDSHVVDNGSSFFGNPPALYTYVIEGDFVRVATSATTSEMYAVSPDRKTLTGSSYTLQLK